MSPAAYALSAQAHTPQTWCFCASLAVRSCVPEAGWHLLPQGKQGRVTSQEFPSLNGTCSCHHPASCTPCHLAHNTWALARGALNTEKLVWLQKCPAGELQAGLVATTKVHGGSSLPLNASGARHPQWWWWVHFFSPCSTRELLLCSSPAWLPFLPTCSLLCCCRIQNRRISGVMWLQPWLCCPVTSLSVGTLTSRKFDSEPQAEIATNLGPSHIVLRHWSPCWHLQPAISVPPVKDWDHRSFVSKALLSE